MTKSRFGEHRELVRGMVIQAARLSDEDERNLAAVWLKAHESGASYSALDVAWREVDARSEAHSLSVTFGFLEHEAAIEASVEAAVARIHADVLTYTQFMSLYRPWYECVYVPSIRVPSALEYVEMTGAGLEFIAAALREEQEGQHE